MGKVTIPWFNEGKPFKADIKVADLRRYQAGEAAAIEETKRSSTNTLIEYRLNWCRTIMERTAPCPNFEEETGKMEPIEAHRFYYDLEGSVYTVDLGESPLAARSK